MTEHQASRSCYVRGCRLPECVAANTRYKAEWRSRPRVSRPGVFESRVAEPPPEWTREDQALYADPACAECHGTGGTYEQPCERCIVEAWVP